MGQVEGTAVGLWSKLAAQAGASWSTWHRAVSRRVWNIPGEGRSAASLGSAALNTLSREWPCPQGWQSSRSAGTRRSGAWWHCWEVPCKAENWIRGPDGSRAVQEVVLYCYCGFRNQCLVIHTGKFFLMFRCNFVCLRFCPLPLVPLLDPREPREQSLLHL